jgi:hypothetical protein
MKISWLILLGLTIVYGLFSFHNVIDWMEQKKVEKEIKMALGNFLTDKCGEPVKVNRVKIENVPSNFMVIGGVEQEWSAQYHIDRDRQLGGHIVGNVEFAEKLIVCRGDRPVSDRYVFYELDSKKKTFVEENLQTKGTGYIGLKENNLLLMKVFGILFVLIFVVSLLVEIRLKKTRT